MMRVMLYEAAQSMLVPTAKWSWIKAWVMRRNGSAGHGFHSKTAHHANVGFAPILLQKSDATD
jgi:hypothetical protein